MVPLLPERVPWYIVGPLIGACIVALYGLANERLGAVGTYAHVAALARGSWGAPAERWRVWFFAGIFAGALLVAVLRGGPDQTASYGALGRVVPPAAIIALLLGGGAVMGFGARWAGGCTSGHGMSGVASRSPASLVATMTFFATAVAVTFVVHTLTGGAL
jgi:uncharacterized protein